MICVSLSNMSFEECLKHARRETFVEFRFDLLDLTPEQVTEVVSKARRSIATYRPETGDPDRQLQTMLMAIKAGASYIDIEIEAEAGYRNHLIREARAHGREVIISYHNFDHTPDPARLDQIVSLCLDAGADVIKIACLVNSKQDLRSLLSTYRPDLRMVVLGMGKLGRITRVAAPFLGAEFTFASPDTGKETAPGQIDRKNLNELILRIQK
jgi:3-dehydroquinate dehydratase type I